MNLKHIWII